jgi:hypothetical protein
MKIAASAVQWQSQHSAVRVEAHTSRLQSWVGQRPSTPDANLPAGGAASSAAGQAGAALARSALHLSEQAQRLLRDKAPSVQGEAVAAPSIDDLGTNLTPLLRMASQLIEEMTGVRANILRLEAGRPSNIEVPDAPSKGGAAANRQPAGWGLEYDSHSVVEEAESTRWAAQGVVRTADGREISFSVELQMQRTYRQESHTSLRLGDAQLTDPLVINFDGSAAELQDMRFAFDLNSDGQASEQVPLLAGNRGFLALDRNQNQRIDAGNELFGPHTGNGFNWPTTTTTATAGSMKTTAYSKTCACGRPPATAPAACARCKRWAWAPSHWRLAPVNLPCAPATTAAWAKSAPPALTCAKTAARALCNRWI